MSNMFGNYYPNTTTAVPNVNNQYYQIPSPQYYQPQNYGNVQANNGIIWVAGEQQAKSYNVQPGMVVPLFDSEAQTVYLKFQDAQGKPQMTILDYVQRDSDNQDNKQSQIEYATKDQINELTKQFKSFGEKLNSLNKYVTKDQFDTLNGHLDDLSGQIEDIEDRITSFGKPQQNSNSNNRRGGK